jgi:hypothetical protein
MTLESLETLTDAQLQEVIARAGELLKQHDRGRKEKALADTRSILASAGLRLKGVTAKGIGIKAAAPSACLSGHCLPASNESELVWSGREEAGLVEGAAE